FQVRPSIRHRVQVSGTLLRKHWLRYAGFSLLEVIIATAILAASSMVLLSLLGLGTKYGNRAEERSLVASQAQSLLEEFLVNSADYAGTGNLQLEEQQELKGVLPGLPSHAYRLTTRPYETSGLEVASSDDRGRNLSVGARAETIASPTASSSLIQVTIQVFDSADENANDAPLLLELSQLVRSSLLAAPVNTSGISVRDSLQQTD
ncbi:MAG: prepilin-type N-terminal cleavage/methylation domain-containing protein, partial [bacterium]|nr:prepilin-type N-terminal cleavage/methylation domain-containing protein [bacterium]